MEMKCFDEFNEEVQQAHTTSKDAGQFDKINISIATEIKQLREIKDVRDELNIIQQVLAQQLDVQKGFFAPSASKESALRALYTPSKSTERRKSSTPNIPSGAQRRSSVNFDGVNKAEGPGKGDWGQWNASHERDAETLCCTINDNRKAVELMLSQAKQAQDAVSS